MCVVFSPMFGSVWEKREVSNEQVDVFQNDRWRDASCFFTKTCAVDDKQMELIILWMFLMACAGFWLRKTYDILRSGTLWRLLKKMIFCWPCFPINFVVSWFIDYCSLPVLASRKLTCMWNTTAWILDNCKLVHFEHQLIAMADEDAVKKTQKVAAEHVESELKFQYFC